MRLKIDTIRTSTQTRDIFPASQLFSGLDFLSLSTKSVYLFSLQTSQFTSKSFSAERRAWLLVKKKHSSKKKCWNYGMNKKKTKNCFKIEKLVAVSVRRVVKQRQKTEHGRRVGNFSLHHTFFPSRLFYFSCTTRRPLTSSTLREKISNLIMNQRKSWTLSLIASQLQAISTMGEEISLQSGRKVKIRKIRWKISTRLWLIWGFSFLSTFLICEISLSFCY